MHKIMNAVGRAATGAAWFFALGTLGGLLFFISQGWPGTGRTTVASTTVGDIQYNAIGLTWTGRPGAVLLWFEAVIIAAAIVASVLPAMTLRRAGHGLLLAWSALWLANGIWLTSYGGPWWLWPAWVGVLGFFFVCTLYRTVRGVRGPSPGEAVQGRVAAGQHDADAVQAVQ